MSKRNLEDQDNLNVIAFSFSAIYVIATIAFIFYVSNQDMWVADASIYIAIMPHAFLFAVATFIVGGIGEVYLPKDEKLVDIEKGLYWVFEVLGQAFDFESKSGRAEFWLYFLWSGIIAIGLEFLNYVTLYSVFLENSFLNFGMIFSITVLIPGLAVGARRLNDTGRSGWLQLLILTIIGIIPLIIFWAQQSKVINKSDISTKVDPKNLASELEKLANMYKSGNISDTEYKKAKSLLLD